MLNGQEVLTEDQRVERVLRYMDPRDADVMKFRLGEMDPAERAQFLASFEMQQKAMND
jgi:hypothetical protein